MSSATNTAVPFNIDGPDRACDGAGCSARACFFLYFQRHPATGLPMIQQRWCRDCVPADWMPGRRLKAEAA